MAQDEAAMVATAQDDGQNIGQEDDGPEDDVAKRSLAPEGRGAGLEERSLYRERRCQAGGGKVRRQRRGGQAPGGGQGMGFKSSCEPRCAAVRSTCLQTSTDQCQTSGC